MVAALGITLIVVLIVWLKVHAFLALTIGSLFVGVFSGTGEIGITKSYENGVGGVLGYVGVLIALGAMLESCWPTPEGGSHRRHALEGQAGGLPWKMALIAAIIGIPMFFEIGLVLLIPVVMLAVRHSGEGDAARHPRPGRPVRPARLRPAHPGPLAAIGTLHANVGITLALGLVVAIPCVVVAGPLFARVAARWVPIGASGTALAVAGGVPAEADVATGRTAPPSPAASGSDAARGTSGDPAHPHPSFGWTLTTVLSPVVLMLLGAAADIWLAKGTWAYSVLTFIGDPVTALLIAVLLAMVTFGSAVGFSLPVLGGKLTESLKPIASVVMIVGAGGGFKQVLVDGGTGDAIAKLAVAANLSVLVMGWLVAVLIRLATGSATVATVTAAGIVSELAVGLSPVHLALVVLAVGAGRCSSPTSTMRGSGWSRSTSDSRSGNHQDLVGDGDHHLGARFLVVGLLWIII